MKDNKTKFENAKQKNKILSIAIEELCAKLIKDSYGSDFRRAELKKQVIEEATKKFEDPNHKCNLYPIDSIFNQRG